LEEKQMLARFAGFGPVALSIFPNLVTGRFKDAGWQAIGEELKTLLTPEEYDSAKRTTFNAFYTSPTVIASIHEAISRLGVPKGATQRRQQMLLLLYRSRMPLNNLRCLAAPAAALPLVVPDRLAQLKKPFPARMVGTTDNQLGETAYGADLRVAFAARRLRTVSHTAGLEASTSGRALDLCSAPLDAATADLGLAHHGLASRRVAGRTLRRRAGDLRLPLPALAPTRRELGRLPDGVGQAADARVSHAGPRRTSAAGRLVGRSIARGRLAADGLRRQPHRMPPVRKNSSGVWARPAKPARCRRST
jgi:hypothetical protein